MQASTGAISFHRKMVICLCRALVFNHSSFFWLNVESNSCFLSVLECVICFDADCLYILHTFRSSKTGLTDILRSSFFQAESNILIPFN